MDYSQFLEKYRSSIDEFVDLNFGHSFNRFSDESDFKQFADSSFQFALFHDNRRYLVQLLDRSDDVAFYLFKYISTDFIDKKL